METSKKKKKSPQRQDVGGYWERNSITIPPFFHPPIIALLSQICVLVVTVSVLCQCTVPKIPEHQVSVYGGNPVPEEHYPYVVGILEITSTMEHRSIEQISLLCTGILIDPKVVLTAGHCLHPESNPLPPPLTIDHRWLPVRDLKIWTPLPSSQPESLGPGADKEKSLWVFQGHDIEKLTSLVQNSPIAREQLVTSLSPKEALAEADGFKIFPTLWVDPLSHGDLGLIRLKDPLVFFLSGNHNAVSSAPPLAPYQAPWDLDVLLNQDKPLPHEDFLPQLIGFGRREDGQYGQKYEAPLAFQKRLTYGSTTGHNVVLGGLYPIPSLHPSAPRPEEEIPPHRVTDSCDGDSGGPLLLIPKKQQDEPHSFESRPFLWGLVSYGVSLNCGFGTAFQNIYQARCWIRQTLTELDDHSRLLSESLNVQKSPASATLAESIDMDPWTGQCRLNQKTDTEPHVPTTAQEHTEALLSLCRSQKPWSSFQTFLAIAFLADPSLKELFIPASSPLVWDPLRCEEVISRMGTLKEIDLEGKGLFDPRPLAWLPLASTLKLGRNQFEKIAFLAHRPVLKSMDVSGNLIQDIDAFVKQWAYSHPEAPGSVLSLVTGKNRQYQNRSPLMESHPQNPGNPFMELCLKESIPPDQKKTFQALFGRTQSQSCHQLWRRILMVDNLLLKRRGITNLAPLSHFSHLISLDLSDNPDLIDVRPLEGLESLKVLKLKGTRVQDLSPLAPLIQRNGLTIEL